MVCRQCRAENPDDKRFCGDCGAALTPAAAMEVPGEEGAYYCWKHAKAVTRVRCGRCERPICVKCMVHSPGGVRCRDCARNRVPVRPMGVLHDAGRALGDPATGRTVWYLALWAFVISIFTGGFWGGHRD